MYEEGGEMGGVARRGRAGLEITKQDTGVARKDGGVAGARNKQGGTVEGAHANGRFTPCLPTDPVFDAPIACHAA